MGPIGFRERSAMKNGEPIRSFSFCYRIGEKTTKFQPGELTDAALVLGDARIPISAITDTSSRLGYLAIAFNEEYSLPAELAHAANKAGVIVIIPRKIASRELELAIDRRSSVIDAQRTRERLKAEGNEDLIRFEQCLVCHSEIDLSGIPETDYLYCRYCGSLFSEKYDQIISAEEYGTCDNCGMFDRIKRYNEFYFYFLVFAWGFNSQQRFVCDACASGLFYKTLFANLLFVVGVPNAISIKVRALTGRDPRLADLARANRLARKGQYGQADPIYDVILERWPGHPGVLTNQALGHINGSDFNGGKLYLIRALASCFQYPPALQLLG